MPRRPLVGLCALLLLAGCGADGEPVQPTMGAHVGLSNTGVHVGGALGLSQGPVSLVLGF
ncbi:MAG: hypothetical protein KDK24_18670 [Pseudooceanicola sp.]|nr:hypothetical protein [Pseudooceanicola sp.]